MNAAKHIRARMSPDFGAAIATVERTMPAEARVIRDYVSALNRECGAWRMQAVAARTELAEIRVVLSAGELARVGGRS